MLECTYFSDARGVHLPGNLLAAPNTDAFRSIMCPVDTQDLFKLAKYCKKPFLKPFKKFIETFSILLCAKLRTANCYS